MRSASTLRARVRRCVKTVPAATVVAVSAALVLLAAPAFGQSGLDSFDPLGPGNLSVSLKILGLLTILTIAPSILLLATAFPRIVIVLGFIRRALSLQEVPPNQIIIGLALVLTFYVMGPTIENIRRDAVVPYMNYEINDFEALDRATNHLRDFMFSQVDATSLDVMIEISDPDYDPAETRMSTDDVDLATLVCAFVLSELKRAFQMGFMIYLPFVVIDLVVASTLISMGMLVLPPVLISLPFKVLVFVLADGWEIVVVQLTRSFS